MAGFVVLITPGSPLQALEADFRKLLHLTANFKHLEIPTAVVQGADCMAAKLDSPASIHPGIVRDDETGSWLFAAGTIVALTGDNDPKRVLVRLLREFIERGVSALDGYDGHFALVIYNGCSRDLSVISDPIGLFSIFYEQRGDNLLISSSALAIAKHTQSPPDVLAVEHFVRTGRLDGDKTLWQDVKRLVGGMVMRVGKGKVEMNEYWSPTFDPDVSRLSFEEALEQSHRLYTYTFSRTLPREGKTWIDLTGGFDSRLVAALAEKANVPFKVYCMGPENHPDVQLSRKISERMKWDYVQTQLPEQWEPGENSWFNMAVGCGDGRASVLRFATTLRGFKERNTNIKTNVTGVGGENLRGLCWQIEKGNMGKTSKLNYPALLDNTLPGAFPIEVMRYNRTQEVRQELSDFITQLCLKYSDLPNISQIDRFEISRDSNHGGAYLSAVTSLERSLAPLCFKALVNFAFSLNYHWRYPRHHVFVRALLERENKLLADVDTTTGGPALPMRLSNVHRFWPLWRDITNRAVAIGSKKILGKSVQVWPQTESSGYPLPAWQTAFHSFARSEGMLTYENMISGGLYNPIQFHTYIERAVPGQAHASEFLDRVVSIEMAMRAVGSLINR